MPASLDAIFGIMGYQSSLILGALYVRLSEGSLVSIAPCSVRSNCLLYLEVKRIVVLSSPIVCSVVREWWTGADCMWEKSESLYWYKSSLEWASC